ncbi:DUF1523 family protein [Ketogulonicigenium vulgare]|uniref:DUF1523 family protein n=1 Tax=Ketogulonicigenium vulgare (strain WSH-001) TaxID=759362 RepID=F9YAI8_KETVW|nr:DUF1523 family protein [Ketogulonicigenium vulgare]ADO43225.1 conserved hypothetical protein [Ketogulonicigenium vulgare Y25]AEM41519.1 hypothetical protein KVU_1680 [Ketogulonicigenium vulgare WSH-001]ALJ81644.1 hypothetical protein KVH_10965 [Ketogulonicigenium vulgare]ANW34315.1 hypothetical protein KvSKV_10880 [Ketogulonicigenium vulgare]AOZ55261.1 hypothetical protein KVC_2256 [Ketogulonicigenium vulgare]
MLKIVKWVFIVALALLVGGVLHYNLPRHDIVRIIGTENRRVTPGWNSMFYSNAEPGSAAGQVRDVFFINTALPNGRERVFRNEDTGWGWPPYFKFSAYDIQAQVANLASTAEAPRWVAVRHYGWRNQFLTIFPNAVKVWEVPGPDTRIIPWFNIIFLTVSVALVWAIAARVIRWRHRRLQPALDRLDQRIDARRAGISRWFKGK